MLKILQGIMPRAILRSIYTTLKYNSVLNQYSYAIFVIRKKFNSYEKLRCNFYITFK